VRANDGSNHLKRDQYASPFLTTTINVYREPYSLSHLQHHLRSSSFSALPGIPHSKSLANLLLVPSSTSIHLLPPLLPSCISHRPSIHSRYSFFCRQQFPLRLPNVHQARTSYMPAPLPSYLRSGLRQTHKRQRVLSHQWSRQRSQSRKQGGISICSTYISIEHVTLTDHSVLHSYKHTATKNPHRYNRCNTNHVYNNACVSHSVYLSRVKRRYSLSVLGTQDTLFPDDVTNRFRAGPFVTEG